MIKMILDFLKIPEKQDNKLISKSNILVKSSLSSRNNSVSAFNILVKAGFGKSSL